MHAIAAQFDSVSSFFYGNVDPCQTTNQLVHVYALLSPPTESTTLASARSQQAVLALHAYGWKLSDVGRLVFGIGLPVREAIRMCQLESPESWPSDAYYLIRRPDLARQNGGKARMDRIDVSSFPQGLLGWAEPDSRRDAFSSLRRRVVHLRLMSSVIRPCQKLALKGWKRRSRSIGCRRQLDSEKTGDWRRSRECCSSPSLSLLVAEIVPCKSFPRRPPSPAQLIHSSLQRIAYSASATRHPTRSLQSDSSTSDRILHVHVPLAARSTD